ncbi:uncharacterized protein LOC114350381 [Ostrinia furnacalis]|uniref:uncharacterized protein LOC114350381 n=1 Tax=Ostrinia furnacalis TaxID=93504 RepID=UPI00103B6389|nr:uncharacterized protein LOC114350381 [Ostrinia furnacalis]
MSYPIKFFSLQKAELEYEVELRGGSGDSVSDLRKQISKLTHIEPEDILESHLEPNEDLKFVKESLLKSQNNIITLKTKFDKNLFLRTETLLNHLYHRINRITNTPEVADVYKVCTSNFNSQYKDLTVLKSQLSISNAPSTSATSNVDSPAISVSCERSLTSDIAKLKFSGKTCVHSFIQKTEEFVQSRGISFEKILSLAYEIFTDDALHWYRYNKDRVGTWQELCDYDYRLAAEIRSRTQGEKENIIIYTSIMHGLFSRLSKPFSDEEKLEVILHNIRPCYANTLAASPEIKSIDDLVSICRNFENIQSRFSSFQEPPRASSNTLAPEFAYKHSTTFTNNNYKNQQNKPYSNYKSNNNTNYKNTTVAAIQSENNSEPDDINNVNVITPNPSQGFCRRCRINGHTLKTCRKDRYIVCFGCGKKDFKYPNCPDCNPKSGNLNQKN